MISLETYYLSGLPIKLENKLGKIYQPTIKYLIENDIDSVDFIKPFYICRIDLIENADKELKDFDIFFSQQKELLNELIKRLKILYRTEDIEVKESIRAIIVDDRFLINRDNYTYLADIVLEMMYATREKPKKKEVKYTNPYLQETWEKLQKYREQQEKKNELQIADIMNMLIHMGDGFDYDKVLNLTYYQMMNSYITLRIKDGYKEFMMYKTSGQFNIEKDIKNWMSEVKLKKSNYSQK